MADSFTPFTTDWSIASRIRVRLDLPTGREHALPLFERLRRDRPDLNRLRRYENELALEGLDEGADGPRRWVSIRRTSVRSGEIGPASMQQGLQVPLLVAETAPNYLHITPLDIDFVELVYTFDVLTSGNHDAIVADAIAPAGPIASLLNVKGAVPNSVQPVFGLELGDESKTEVQFAVRTRPSRHGADEEPQPSPISIVCALRCQPNLGDERAAGAALKHLARRGQELVDHRLVPYLLRPIHQVITTNNL